jgi:NTP pyrophosphatase (non-canonical NTP hydrolase)
MQTFNEYQEFVKGMKVYPQQFAIMYPALGLAGEAGEITEKIKKWLRDDQPQSQNDMSEERRQAILLELGDPLWYIAALADDMGFTMDDVVAANVGKLTSRKERGVVHGSGDNR